MSAPPSASAPPASSAPPSAKASASKFDVGGHDRPTTVFVPAPSDPARPAPLLIVLHGYSSSGFGHDSYFGLREAALARGFVYAYANGSLDSTGNRFWNATDACCDFDASGVDDVGYLLGVIEAIESQVAIDPKRIALIGHSNGAFMAFRMACERADLISAVIGLAGATFADPTDCAPSAPVAIVAIHGTGDRTILYAGGTIEGLGSGDVMAAYPGALETASIWATYDGCGTSAVVPGETIDVDADVSVDGQPAETTVTRWTGCADGGAVELWTIPDGIHAPTISASFADPVFDFIEAHPKP